VLWQRWEGGGVDQAGGGRLSVTDELLHVCGGGIPIVRHHLQSSSQRSREREGGGVDGLRSGWIHGNRYRIKISKGS